MAKMNFVRAMRAALAEEMRRDPRVFVMGEDVESALFGITQGLVEEFGRERVRNTPISEAGFAGAAVGAAAAGLRPFVDLMYGTFAYVAMDQLANQAAKLRYMTGGQVSLPIVYQMITGGGHAGAAQHSESPHAMLMNVPGLKVVYPSNAYDAKGLLKSAIRDEDPVVFFNHLAMGMLKSEIPDEEYLIPLGVADIKREGGDLTLVAIGHLVAPALQAAESLAKRGVSVEVVDPRTLSPLDKETILASLAKTGRLMVADDSPRLAGAAAEIAAMAAEEGFEYLKAPIQRVTRLHVPVPFNLRLENHVVPGRGRIEEAILKLFGLERQAKEGVGS